MGTRKIVLLIVGLLALVGLGIYGYNNNAYGPLVGSYHKAIADETGELNALADKIKLAKVSYDECSGEDPVLSECEALGELIDEASQIEQIPRLPDNSTREEYWQRRNEVRDNVKLARETRENLEKAIEELESAEPEPTPTDEPTEEESPEEEPEETPETRESSPSRDSAPEPQNTEPPASDAPEQPRRPAPAQPEPAPVRPTPEQPQVTTPAPTEPPPSPSPIPPVPEPTPEPEPEPTPDETPFEGDLETWPEKED